MSIIKTHDITLYGGSKNRIVLRPLCDEHLPFLYKWCADSEVLYWTEGGTDDLNLSYDEKTVHDIYGGASQNALCFLIEADGVPIGECWLQKMNLLNVKAMYPENLDVRRIDMCIGEKDYWNKGIGTQFIGMMVDFAFCGEHVEILHCFCEDYNVRSRRMWEKHGFTQILAEQLPQPQKGKWQYHYRLTRSEFLFQKGRKISPVKQFLLPIAELQPSRLYINEGKLHLIKGWFELEKLTSENHDYFDPIPIVKINDRIVMTDGHSRALAALQAGWDTLPVYWIEEEQDIRTIENYLTWCDEEGIHKLDALIDRIVSYNEYQRLWCKRCMELI